MSALLQSPAYKDASKTTQREIAGTIIYQYVSKMVNP